MRRQVCEDEAVTKTPPFRNSWAPAATRRVFASTLQDLELLIVVLPWSP